MKTRLFVQSRLAGLLGLFVLAVIVLVSTSGCAQRASFGWAQLSPIISAEPHTTEEVRLGARSE